MRTFSMKTDVGGIPLSILNDQTLSRMIETRLPANYNFEIQKTVWRIVKSASKMVALQFPEGLLMYSCIISDIIEVYTGAETLIMGDVTYGACCVDDFSAKELGADLLVHYGHSCLVPVNNCSIDMLYVFVDISYDVGHFVETVIHNFNPDETLVLSGTVQFIKGIQESREPLGKHFPKIIFPQEKPLSRGEVLGCTAPVLPDGPKSIIFVSDGRFHLEALMIANPGVPAFKYNPYDKKITEEFYDYDQMVCIRKESVDAVRNAKKFGLILGTLGRQGSSHILQRLKKRLTEMNLSFTIVLLSEVFPSKLDRFSDIDVWVQIACPRLSIDWGYAFSTPLLTPYEMIAGLDSSKWNKNYPMDNYSSSGGQWSNYYEHTKAKTSPTSCSSSIPAKERLKAARAARKKKLEIEITD